MLPRRWRHRTAAVLLGLFFALAFDTAFARPSTPFFAAGTWQFGPDSNLLRFFPEPFWYEIALVAGVTILLGAVMVALAGPSATCGRTGLRGTVGLLGYTRAMGQSIDRARPGWGSACTRPGW